MKSVTMNLGLVWDGVSIEDLPHVRLNYKSQDALQIKHPITEPESG